MQIGGNFGIFYIRFFPRDTHHQSDACGTLGGLLLEDDIAEVILIFIVLSIFFFIVFDILISAIVFDAHRLRDELDTEAFEKAYDFSVLGYQKGQCVQMWVHVSSEATSIKNNLFCQ